MGKMSKQRFVSGNSLGGLQLSVGLEFHSVIDYDRKKMRRALVLGGNEVRQEARRLLSRRGIASLPGELPAFQHGRLMRSIGTVTKGSKGGWVKIGPRTIKGSVFYPAFLFYGSPKTNLDKRENFMATALTAKRETVRNQIRRSLRDSLVPR